MYCWLFFFFFKHSSILAWKIPWISEPGGLPSMGSQRVGHDRTTSLSLLAFFFFLMLKLKPQYFGHMMRRVDFGKGPDAGKD